MDMRMGEKTYTYQERLAITKEIENGLKEGFIDVSPIHTIFTREGFIREQKNMDVTNPLKNEKILPVFKFCTLNKKTNVIERFDNLKSAIRYAGC